MIIDFLFDLVHCGVRGTWVSNLAEVRTLEAWTDRAERIGSGCGSVKTTSYIDRVESKALPPEFAGQADY